MLDDGTSVIPIFEATQAGQVVQDDITEPPASTAQQAKMNRTHANKALMALANRNKAEIEIQRQSQATENRIGNVQPKAKKRKKVLWEIVLEPVAKPTYWDKSVAQEERRARAKRIDLQAASENEKADDDDDEVPIRTTLAKRTKAHKFQAPKRGE